MSESLHTSQVIWMDGYYIRHMNNEVNKSGSLEKNHTKPIPDLNCHKILAAIKDSLLTNVISNFIIQDCKSLKSDSLDKQECGKYSNHYWPRKPDPPWRSGSLCWLVGSSELLVKPPWDFLCREVKDAAQHSRGDLLTTIMVTSPNMTHKPRVEPSLFCSFWLRSSKWFSNST